MDPVASIVGISMAAGLLFILQPLLTAWLKSRRSSVWVITCPATSNPALVEVRHSSIFALRGRIRLRIHECSQRPRSRQCAE
ncbi:MAG TPA: hypothetical protein VJ732_10515, partial [Bryobacteraceae bacterium]|nr:hypothetical protein [Bryobacteraceae bacterium]